MALYKVRINKKVRKKELPSIAPIVDRIQKLADNPFLVDAVHMKGRDEWRIRQGDYRILYIVKEQIVTVFVVKVGHRREVYKG